jgi:hypothetical protein
VARPLNELVAFVRSTTPKIRTIPQPKQQQQQQQQVPQLQQRAQQSTAHDPTSR